VHVRVRALVGQKRGVNRAQPVEVSLCHRRNSAYRGRGATEYPFREGVTPLY
jgi:hypothetical protein